MVAESVSAWLNQGLRGWDRFWFTPRDVGTLAVMRIGCGAMLLYTHLAWGLAFRAFFGQQPWISEDIARDLQESVFAWSHFFVLRDEFTLRAIHLAALFAFALFTLGLYTRASAMVSALAAISYVHRQPGALFGLDQINVLLATYLTISDCGRAFSLDAYFARRSGRTLERETVANCIASRLIQLHMCIIYMFAGMAKLQGPAWWNGEAMWGAIAIQEYQSWDVTWLVHFPSLLAVFTYLTLYWEIYYVALVWPSWSRPVVLFLALPLHMGIAICLGMITFGLIMIVGNMAFVPPAWTNSVAHRLTTRKSGSQD